jgi:hypothetical protein
VRAIPPVYFFAGDAQVELADEQGWLKAAIGPFAPEHVVRQTDKARPHSLKEGFFGFAVAGTPSP